MSLKISDFGPIEDAEIELKRYTILIGKNNLGKSYLTQLFHIFYNVFRFQLMGINELYYVVDRPFRRERRLHLYSEYEMGYRFRAPMYEIKISNDVIIEIRKRLRNKRINNKNIFTMLFTIFNKNIPKSLNDNIQIALERTYGTELKNLVSINKTKSIIQFEYNEYNTLHIEITNKGTMKIQFKPNRVQLKNLEIKIIPIIDDTRKLKRLTEKRIIQFMLKCLEPILTMSVLESIYIPAGRAGLIEGYDTLVSIFIDLASVAPLYGITMPPIHGLASEFYNVLFSLRGGRGPYYAIAEKMVDILGGSITIRRPRGLPSGAGRFYYTFKMEDKTRSIPVIQAASMIKELTPIYLIIRESFYPNSIITIEEPESHLHPSAQCHLVEVFSELISKETNIIITTHSDLLVRKIGNLIGRYKYPEKENAFSINPESVVLYLIKEQEKGSISKIIPIPDDGVFEEIPEFDEVVNELYEEQLKYQRYSQMEV